MKRVLLVTYEFPPRGGPGVQRPLKLAKYLGRWGWDVTVLTVEDPPTSLVDASMLDELPSNVKVVRAWSLEPTRLLQTVKRRIRRSRVVPEPHVQGTRVQGFSGAPAWTIRLIQGLFLPDEKRLWGPWAVKAGMRACAENHCDVVISTGPPHTAHLVGAEIAKRLGIAHIIDLRDPWIGYFDKYYLTPFHQRLDTAMEKRVVSHTRAIVTVTQPIAAMYHKRYPTVPVHVILNGHDVVGLPPQSRPITGFVLTYTGTFSGPRRPDTFLAGVAAAEECVPGLRDDLRIVVAGAGQELVDVARGIGVHSRIDALGYVDHERSLRLLSESSAALLVLSTGEESRVSLSGKVFEYIGMRKPILAVVGEGAAAELVRSVRGGRVASFDDPDAIADALEGLYTSWADGSLTGPSEEEAARYSRVGQAREYALLLDEVIGAHPHG